MTQARGAVEFRNVRKTFGQFTAIPDLSLTIEPGELVTLLGPSGCGKTTTLRMLAGLETPTAGQILIGGQDVTRLPADRRDVSMVFQSYALFPHMSVAQNVAYGLEAGRMKPAEARERAAEALSMVGLGGLGGRLPAELSGGQQQRVAVARALVLEPQVLLLDEPLSNLDARLRRKVRTEIRELQQRLGFTAVYVTHDQEEALAMSDRIVVMRDGVAEQIGDPFEIYNRPATRFVASFVGTLNVLDARLLDPATGLVTVDGQEIRLGRAVRGKTGEPVPISLRPQAILLGSGTDLDGRLRGRVDSVSFLGSVVRIRVALDGQNLSVDIFNTSAMRPPKPGETVDLAFATGDVLVLEGPAD